MPDSAPARGDTSGNEASEIPRQSSSLHESSPFAETPICERDSPTGIPRGPSRSSWPDAFREATAIDINIAGFRVDFRVGLLLIVLLGLSFLYLILQAKQPASGDTQSPNFLQELEPNKSLSSAGNVTKDYLEVPEETNATPAHQVRNSTVGKALFYMAWAAAINIVLDLLSIVLDLLPIKSLIDGFYNLITQLRKRILRRRLGQPAVEYNNDPDSALLDTSISPITSLDVMIAVRHGRW